VRREGRAGPGPDGHVSSRDPHPPGQWLLPLFLTGSALTAIAAVVVAVERAPPPRPPEPARPPLRVLAPPADSIAAEAEVFRTAPSMMAIAPGTRRGREAHPRTLATYHYLRAFPGAPPRISHGLTPEEFRAGGCNACHERGGYSRRFDAYVPLTPHPDQEPCLQCHLGADPLMAVPLVGPDPDRRCRQCHGAGGEPRSYTERSLDWVTTAWPSLAPRRPGQPPPPILHAREPRGNCVACHAGPAAVDEIRTTHPEWANCRQCHVGAAPEAEAFTHSGSADSMGAGSEP
jgi:cytochrome c-type protein NapB